MSAVAFDTLKLAARLEQSGFSAEQAKGAASALSQVLGDELATKTYLDSRLNEVQLTIGGMIVGLGGVLIAIKCLGH